MSEARRKTPKETPVKNLTDRYLKSLKPAAPGQRYEIRDGVQPALAVRVTDKGSISLVLRARFPGGRHFTRKALGSYPKIELADARKTAKKWLGQIGEGKDPKSEAAAEAARLRAEAERLRAQQLKRQKDSFVHVAERYIAEALPLQRQGKKVARTIRNVLIPRWGEKPIADIDRADVVALLKDRRKTPATAHNILVYLRCLFAWAIETQEFGLQNAPTDHVKPKKLIGARKQRERKLTDTELVAFWKCANAMPYPEGPAYQLLALSGLRLNEAVQARWHEINIKKREWVIPASRMKGTDDKAREHLVPLTDAMIKILDGLPIVEGSDFVFTVTGKNPVQLGGKAKDKLDTLMLAELRISDPKAKLAQWQNHDLRRSCRSTLAALGVPAVVGEAVLAHRQGGIAQTYDRHDYRPEKLDALRKWNDYLLGLAGPESAPENVVKLRRSA